MCVCELREPVRAWLSDCVCFGARRAAQRSQRQTTQAETEETEAKAKAMRLSQQIKDKNNFYFNWQVGAPCGGSEDRGASGGGGLCQAVKMRTAFASCGANKRKHNNNDNNNKSTFALEIDFDKVREYKFMVPEYTKKKYLM